MRQISATYSHSVTKCKEWKNYTIGNSEESIPNYKCTLVEMNASGYKRYVTYGTRCPM
jgi:hypothetical protein